MKRNNSIDVVRGLVMVIMALDHVRDLLHVDAITQSPTDLSTTTPVLFFTRWVTHLCAPTFVFLAGVSAYLYCSNQETPAQGRNFLLTRGLWLIFLEFTVVTFGLWFDPGFHTIYFQVIAAIGFGFIILSLMLSLPATTLGLVGLIILFCHNLVPLIPLEEGSVVKSILSPFFGPGAFPITANRTFIMGYPPIPWLGVLLAGYGAGQLYALTDNKRKAAFLKIELGALLLFVLIRSFNVYGDPVDWAPQKDVLYSFLSFINLTKYPPSLLFCLTTLGIMFFMLRAVDGQKNRALEILSVYGKVPLFYFILHFYLIHTILILVLLLQGFHWSDLDFTSGTFGRPRGVESGVTLGSVFALWMVVVIALYLPCRWFGQYKATHKQWWLKYI